MYPYSFPIHALLYKKSTRSIFIHSFCCRFENMSTNKGSFSKRLLKFLNNMCWHFETPLHPVCNFPNGNQKGLLKNRTRSPTPKISRKISPVNNNLMSYLNSPRPRGHSILREPPMLPVIEEE